MNDEVKKSGQRDRSLYTFTCIYLYLFYLKEAAEEKREESNGHQAEAAAEAALASLNLEDKTEKTNDNEVNTGL